MKSSVRIGSFINVNFSISPIYLNSDMRSKILDCLKVSWSTLS